MKNKLILSLLLFLGALAIFIYKDKIFSVFSKNHSTLPLLIKNWKSNMQGNFRNFRTTQSLSSKKAKKKKYKGLSKVQASGSAQIFYEHLKELQNRLPGKKIIVVDLRQESHGFIIPESQGSINRLPVSWYGLQNTVNTDKSLDEIESDEVKRLSQLADNHATVYTLVKGEKGAPHSGTDPLTVKVNHYLTEKDICDMAGVGYIRIPIQDFHAPEDEQVDRFVELIKNLDKNDWLHFHCSAGRGRTTTFMAMYDMMLNANKISLKDIVERQIKLGGVNLLTDYSKKHNWKYYHYLKRAHFITKFYDYAKEASKNKFKQKWSDWLKQSSKPEEKKVEEKTQVATTT